eukprot:jgi/Undpi1/8742/HiC_scaffold_25.g11204.m1
MEAFTCDLQTLLRTQEKIAMTPRHIRMSLLGGVISGLEYLQSELGFVHGDIKPSNLMVDGDMTCLKICDCGLGGKSGKDDVMGFTKEYAAPEAVMYYPEDHSGRRVTLSPPMDVYAVALIALQMLFVQERPRTDAQEIARRGLRPKGKQFEVAIENCEYLRQEHRHKGGLEAYDRWDKAEELLDILYTDYGTQIVKMADLNTTLFRQGRWTGFDGLHHGKDVR